MICVIESSQAIVDFIAVLINIGLEAGATTATTQISRFNGLPVGLARRGCGHKPLKRLAFTVPFSPA